MWMQDEDVDFTFVMFWRSGFMFSKPGTIILVKAVLEFDLGYIPLIISQPLLLPLLMGDKVFEGFGLGNHIAFYKLQVIREKRKEGN